MERILTFERFLVCGGRTLSSPLPLRERVPERRRSRARAGEGLACQSSPDPSPGSPSLSLRLATLSHKAERGSARVAPHGKRLKPPAAVFGAVGDARLLQVELVFDAAARLVADLAVAQHLVDEFALGIDQLLLHFRGGAGEFEAVLEIGRQHLFARRIARAQVAR